MLRDPSHQRERRYTLSWQGESAFLIPKGRPFLIASCAWCGLSTADRHRVYRSRRSYSALALAALKRLSPKDTGILGGAASEIPHRFLPRRGGPLLSFSTCKPFERTQHQTPRV